MTPTTLHPCVIRSAAARRGAPLSSGRFVGEFGTFEVGAPIDAHLRRPAEVRPVPLWAAVFVVAAFVAIFVGALVGVLASDSPSPAAPAAPGSAPPSASSSTAQTARAGVPPSRTTLGPAAAGGTRG